ncbi:hypothetical protein ERJ75_000763800 [Trypanosoma vivax]|uniref:Putative exosome component CSL4 n=1 Tax=Trypanosoma vivax (strain Y486) TaxID=1055687 RepID=G0TVA9_TRYVY|nr:putative exosome component CSL4 [Trypanosoma vivax]KAH8613665.1 hypothetical protein ERJ75_000763800 [Trypanosoma vivax]CCC47875.1 putative exosome component CSL4 [Trypanosoma vivax Y486]
MVEVVTTGKSVSPGDIVYSAASLNSSAADVSAGVGCFVRDVGLHDASTERQIVSAVLGVVQWSGGVVSVVRPCKRARETIEATLKLRERSSGSEIEELPAATSTPSVLAQSTVVFGPRMGDNVHLRVLRVSRYFAYGEIIAVNGCWCSSSAVCTSPFRGVIRVEDIRPFKPGRDKLTPPPPSAAFQSGDVVIATVLSQSDVRQYQLSTLSEDCGVIESFVALREAGSEARVQLQHIPGRRDAMRCPVSAAVHYRWCPLILTKA